MLTPVFLFYAILTTLLGIGVNSFTLSLFSNDGLSPQVINRIHSFQLLYFGMAIAFMLLFYLLKRFNSIRISDLKINLLLTVSFFLYLVLTTEKTLALKYIPDYTLWPNYSLRTPIAVPDSNLGYVLNPKLDHSYHINSRALRGNSESEFPLRKAVSEIRIIATGDSNIFGWGIIDDAETFPSKLDRLLARRFTDRDFPYNFRVINAGIPGYSSRQVNRFVESRLLSYEPDLIILCVGWNDLVFSTRPDWTPDASHIVGLTQDRIFSTNSEFSPAIFQAAAAIKRYFVAPMKETEKAVTVNPDALNYYRSNLIYFIKTVKMNNTKLLILNLPTIMSRHRMTESEIKKEAIVTQAQFEQFQNTLDAVCKETETPYITDLFSLDQTDKDQFLLDHCHPNVNGTSLMAEKVSDYLYRRQELLIPKGK